ncbi:MAG: indole-3-glycerol phosphate synthase TrpC [Armatimonadetes bacterium]|nr:indole-3-glycerol phosphate synthase TrpC [Armatimonadota bacterium]
MKANGATSRAETLTSGTVLDEIMEVKRAEVQEARERLPVDQVKLAARAAAPPRDFARALRTERRMHLIAEVKKASPSKGIFRPDFDPLHYIAEYDGSGADAISILTDQPFFQGSPETLKAAGAITRKPCLRKDFLFDDYQVWEARAWGADAVLLIVAVLPGDRLGRLLALCHELEMAALVEVHTLEELRTGLGVGARILGINNRDLQSFKVDLNTTLDLRDQIPEDVIVVSESGIKTREDVSRLEEAGVNAILVGESLIRAESVPRKIAELLGEED